MSARWVMILGGIGLFLGGLALFASAPEQERVAEVGVAEVLREIGTLQVAREAVQPRARFSGVLEARRTVKLFAETHGPVLEVGAEALDRVEAGQRLVRIADRLQAALAPDVNVGHARVERTRPDERVNRDQVVESVAAHRP